jgi:molybdopterin molybdotransferase
MILRQVAPIRGEEVALTQALGRVVTEDVDAVWDMPYCDNSGMDGYAFSHASLEGNLLKVTGFIPAGVERTVPVPPGEAVKIMTGAPVPMGCDTVIPVEEVEEAGDCIKLRGNVKPGRHIRRKGEDVRQGERVISCGTMLRPGDIGTLAYFGKESLSVHGRPRVGIIATGDELVEMGSDLSPATKINSNSYSISAQVTETGAVPIIFGIARDTRESTRERILAALEADVIITSGGVSVGDRDHVKEGIEELGGEIVFWKVNMKPGKPVAFATLNGKCIFALPGNPVAAMIGFEQFVRPALLKMMGHRSCFRPKVEATASDSFRNKGDRPHLVLCRLRVDGGRYLAGIASAQSSANIALMGGADGFLELGPGESVIPGAEVAVTLLNRDFEMRAAI